EQFTPGHDRGSSHGQTRLFRVACMEHPALPVIARRSRELWEELQPYAGEPILETCGGIMIGLPGSPVISGTLAAARAHDLPAEPAGARQFALSRFPAFIRQFADGHGIWGHGAGDSYGIKVGAERDETFPAIDPDKLERTTSPRDHELVSSLVAGALPGLNPIP